MEFSHAQKYSYLIKAGLIGLLLFGIAMIAITPMLLHSYPITHSTQFNLSWAFQYQRQFWSGQVYPRWLEFSNFGFGNATFVFYPPMLMIATLPFSLLGMDLPASLVGSMVIAAFTLAWGIYLYASLYFPSWFALVVSGLAVSSPYFLIDIYQRGAIAEVWAIAFIPWILLSTHKLIGQIHLPPSQRTHAISLAIAWGMMGLSHLPTLLIGFLAWLTMPLWLLKDLPQELMRGASCQTLILGIKNYIVEVGRCYLSASLGFVGISFFLLPVIFDQKLVQIDSVNFSPEYLPQNRLLLDGLLSLNPKFANHWFETSSGMIPYFWILLAVMMISAIALMTNRFLLTKPSLQSEPISQTKSFIFNQPSLNRTMCLWMIISAIALLMTTDLGSWIYQLVPTLQKIQFSWRWYGLTVTTIPMLLGGLFWQILQKTVIAPINKESIFVWGDKAVPPKNDSLFYGASLKIISISLILGLIVTSYVYTDKIVFQHTGFDAVLITKFASLTSQKEFPKEPDATGKGTPILWWHWSFPDGLAIVDVPEYRAKGVTLAMPPDHNQPLARSANLDQPSMEHIQIQEWKFGLRKIFVENQSSPDVENLGEYLILRMFYYPAWQVWIDGKSAVLEATSQGQVQISIPHGQHLVLVKYVGTKAEQLGRTISWLIIIMVVGYIFYVFGLQRQALSRQAQA